MSWRVLVTWLGCLCLCLLAVSACGAEEEAPPATLAATGVAASPTIPRTTAVAATGEEVERLATTAVQRVTWEDATTYEESVADLVFRTAGMPEAGRGYRTVAGSLGGSKWQVTIFMRVADHSTEPPTSVDLLAEFYYDETTGAFTAVNGRAEFALTGRNPCPSPEAQSEYCPLDKQVLP